MLISWMSMSIFALTYSTKFRSPLPSVWNVIEVDLDIPAWTQTCSVKPMLNYRLSNIFFTINNKNRHCHFNRLTCGTAYSVLQSHANASIDFPRRFASFTLKGCRTAKYLRTYYKYFGIVVKQSLFTNWNRERLY